MEKKQSSAARTVTGGVLLALGVYLGVLLVLALLLVRGVVGEEGALPMVAACAAVAAFCGGLWCVRSCPWGRLPSALAGAVGFGGVLACVALCWKDGAAWTGSGGVVLACVLAGGVLAGLVGRRRGKRVKKAVRRRL